MLYAGDEVTVVTRLVDLYDKKEGRLRFVVQDADLADAAGRLCVRCRSTFVVRAPEQAP